MAFTCTAHCLRSIATAFVLLVAGAAHGVVYKWVEEDGNVIYSNEPPPDQSKVRELTKIDDLELVPDQENRSSPSPVAAPAPVTLQSREPVTLLPREPVTLLPKDPAAVPREIEPPPRVIPRSTHTGAVQDPCLISPDPRCHERNKERYHPFAGYSPPAVQAVGVR